jgi:bifunctional DNA-binding transcriptional regulator/antitoxin component of YhaV-PrlF toxin-antitoxin module
MTTIVKTTTKGQITLPSSWRKQFCTNQFILSCEGDVMKIQPIELDKILKKEKKEKIIFNAIRDGKGRGISVKNLLKVLKKIDE